MITMLEAHNIIASTSRCESSWTTIDQTQALCHNAARYVYPKQELYYRSVPYGIYGGYSSEIRESNNVGLWQIVKISLDWIPDNNFELRISEIQKEVNNLKATDYKKIQKKIEDTYNEINSCLKDSQRENYQLQNYKIQLLEMSDRLFFTYDYEIKSILDKIDTEFQSGSKQNG